MAALVRSYSDLTPPVVQHPGSRVGGNRESTIDDVLVLLERLHPEWHRQALCRGMTEQFFPGQGDSNAGRLKTICNQCPVQAQCLDYAVTENIKAGWWGGLGEKERRRIRRARGLMRGYER